MHVQESGAVQLPPFGQDVDPQQRAEIQVKMSQLLLMFTLHSVQIPFYHDMGVMFHIPSNKQCMTADDRQCKHFSCI